MIKEGSNVEKEKVLRFGSFATRPFVVVDNLPVDCRCCCAAVLCGPVCRPLGNFGPGRCQTDCRPKKESKENKIE
jgi:hypothetical protein